MEIWWSALTTIQKVFWVTAVFASVFFALQTIITLFFIGDHDADADSGGDFDTDMHDGQDMSEAAESSIIGYFTIRNMVGFLLGFSWGGLACIDSGLNNTSAVFCGIGIGLVFVLIIMILMKSISKLKSSGNILIKNAVGKEATVSIVIPANSLGKGKVSLALQGRLIDIESITKGEEIKPGQKVKVIGIQDTQLIVEKI